MSGPDIPPTPLIPTPLIPTGVVRDLRIVEVRAPDINFVFDPSGHIQVTDIAPPIPLMGVSGSGFLQSRLFPKGVAGTVAAGKFAYEYRIDMSRFVAPALQVVAIHALSLDFGPVVELNFDGSGPAGVFVTTEGAIGSVRPSKVSLAGDRLTIMFEPSGVPAGAGSAAPGKSSFFIGLVSDHPPRDVTAELSDLAATGMPAGMTPAGMETPATGSAGMSAGTGPTGTASATGTAGMSAAGTGPTGTDAAGTGLSVGTGPMGTGTGTGTADPHVVRVSARAPAFPGAASASGMEAGDSESADYEGSPAD